jgi:hypothetical protein
MAKPSTPSRPSRKVPPRKAHRYIDALVSDDFGRQSTLTTHSANSFARKKLDAASQSLQRRAERNDKKARRIEIREWRSAERSVAAELRDADHRHRLLWRSLKTKVRPDKKLKHTPPKERKRDWPHASVALPKYDGPVIDRRGHRGVFARFRYYSKRTAKSGVSSRVVKYCFNGAELDIDGNPYVATNVGETIDEALCGFDHLEQVNWSAAKNAKLLMHGIFAVDHRQSPDEMMTCGVRWAEETLGRFNLPYLVTLHAPPAGGDQRNWHLHILWSYRPLVRTGDHEWQVGEMLRTDLDNPAAMKAFREIFASVMTEMSFESGQNQVWTAKSNADRGLVHEPQVHLGGEKTNRVRDGKYVADNEENHERVLRAKAAVIDEDLRHAGEEIARASDRIRDAMARWARAPVLPMQLPQRLAATATAMAIDPPLFAQRPLPSPMAIEVPAVPLPARPSSPAMAPVPRVATASSLPRIVPIDIPAALPPAAPPRIARIDFANLRNRPIPPLAQRIVPVVTSLAPRPAAANISVAPRRSISLPTPFQGIIETGPPPTAAQPSRLRISAFPIMALPQPVATDRLDQCLVRTAQAEHRAEDRRKRDREAAKQSASLAKAAAAERERQDQALRAGQAERETQTKGWASYRARRREWMAQWAETERFDGAALKRPGRHVPRPGTDKDVEEPVDVRPVRGLPDRGIGD